MPTDRSRVRRPGRAAGAASAPYESEPSYQKGVQSTGYRTIPDVAFDGSSSSGVAVYDSYDNTGGGPWVSMWGTSLGAPSWAALIAVADQGRVAAGGTTLDGPSQTLPGPVFAAVRRLPRHHQREQRVLQRRDWIRQRHRKGHARR